MAEVEKSYTPCYYTVLSLPHASEFLSNEGVLVLVDVVYTLLTSGLVDVGDASTTF